MRWTKPPVKWTSRFVLTEETHAKGKSDRYHEREKEVGSLMDRVRVNVRHAESNTSRSLRRKGLNYSSKN